MGMLNDGKWSDDDDRRSDKRGAFQRVDSKFRDRVTADGSSGFKAEPGRYHIYIAHNCPWAHRTAMLRKIKKLEDMITMSISDMPKLHGWGFSDLVDVADPSADGAFYLYQVYQASDPHVTSRVTVPTLWDRETKTVVNNESSEIIRMLNSAFDEWGDASLDFYPVDLRGEIDRINDMVYPGLNNGVYRSGFARSQEAYEEAVARVFDTLHTMEDTCHANAIWRASGSPRRIGAPSPHWSASIRSITPISSATRNASATIPTCRTTPASCTSIRASPTRWILQRSRTAISAT